MRKLLIPIILTVVLSFPALWLMRSIDWLAEPASAEADVTDNMILLTFDIATVIFVLCVVFLVYSLVVFRRDPEDMSDGQHFHGNTMLEIAWTIVPTIIVLGLWWLGIEEMNKVNLGSVMAGNVPANALRVGVTGQQWAWSFDYPGIEEELPDSSSVDGEDLLTEDLLPIPVRSPELIIPIDRPIFFEIETVDVIHSFWIPEMRFKMDAIPGRTNYIVYTPNKLGNYKVRCAEICGTDHSMMLADVKVVPAEEFEAYINASREASKIALVESIRNPGGSAVLGEKLAQEYGCTACHSADGTVEGKVGPTWKDLWDNERVFADGATGLADDAYLSSSILAPADQIVEGYQNVMPANFTERFTDDYGETEKPVMDLIEYIKSLDEEYAAGEASDG